MKQYDFHVKSNVESGADVPVRILSREVISESVLNMLKNMRLDDARKYCQNILKATFLVR